MVAGAVLRSKEESSVYFFKGKSIRGGENDPRERGKMILKK